MPSRRSGDFAVLLEQAVADAALLQAREVLDEDAAVQVVDLVLDADGQQALGLEREGFAIEAQRPHGDPVGPLDFLVDAGHRQAALLVALGGIAGRDDLGLAEYAPVGADLGAVGDAAPPEHADLRARQADRALAAPGS